jgi:hypothetical protein
MKEFNFTLLLCLLFTFSGFSQQDDQVDADTTYWKKHLNVGLNINQASFSSNWRGGGTNSLGFNTVLNYKANYLKEKHSWDNEIDLAYGILNNEGQGSRKSVDKIYLDSKYGIKIGEKWNFYFAGSFLSQFDDGFDYEVTLPNGEVVDSLISTFLAPGYLTFSAGFEYKPVDYFYIRLSPFSPRFTFVTDDKLSSLGAYGVNPGDNVRTEWLAFQLTADFEKEIAKNLTLKWKYFMFVNYETFDFDKWDHRLDISLTAKVNDFLNVNLGGIVIYDFDQIDEVQLNQYFNLGLSLNVKNFTEEEK